MVPLSGRGGLPAIPAAFPPARTVGAGPVVQAWQNPGKDPRLAACKYMRIKLGVRELYDPDHHNWLPRAARKAWRDAL